MGRIRGQMLTGLFKATMKSEFLLVPPQAPLHSSVNSRMILAAKDKDLQPGIIEGNPSI
jgi:hypothetical protein